MVIIILVQILVCQTYQKRDCVIDFFIAAKLAKNFRYGNIHYFI